MKTAGISAYLAFALCCLLPFFVHVESKGSSESYRLGLVYSLSGPAAMWAQSGLHAVELAVEECNAAGGIDGKRIELHVEDAATRPSTAVSSFLKLANQKDVPVILGDVWAMTTNPLIPLADRLHQVLISPTVIDRSVEVPSPYFFTLGGRVELVRDAVEQFFQANSAVKTLAVFCWDDSWGDAYRLILQQVGAASGVRIPFEFCTNDFSYDYLTEVARLARVKPDAVFVSNLQERIIPLLYQRGIDVPILTTNNVQEAIVRQQIPRQMLAQTYVIDWLAQRDFTERYHRRFGVPPFLEAYAHYDAAQLAIAVLAAKETKPRDVLTSSAFRGLAGAIDFRHSFAGNMARATLRKADDLF